MASRRTRYLAAWATALGAAGFIYLGETALGINGEPSLLTKRLEMGVLAVVVIGAILARLRPLGMTLAMFAAALAQAAAGMAALAGGLHRGPGGSALEIIGLNLLFALMLAASGLVFRSAARAR